jgi:hypothetical protein
MFLVFLWLGSGCGIALDTKQIERFLPLANRVSLPPSHSSSLPFSGPERSEVPSVGNPPENHQGTAG